MLDDLALAWRRVRNSPGFSLVAIVTLALAIGANTAILSIADAVLFRPLPYADPDRLFVLRVVDPKTRQPSPGLVPVEYTTAIAEHHSGITGLGVRGTITFTPHLGDGGWEYVETTQLSPGYLAVLGIRPMLGRDLSDEDAKNPNAVALLSYSMWQQRFGGDPSIVGRSMHLGTGTREIIGVLPRGFVYPVQLVPRSGQLTGGAEYFTVHPPSRRFGLEPVLRLKSGVSIEHAQSELDAICASVIPANAKQGPQRFTLEPIRDVMFPSGRRILLLLMASAAFILLLGCANLAHMMLARSKRRQRELGIHAALGASRLRLVRPVAFEALILGVAGAALALLATSLSFDAFVRQVPPAVDRHLIVGVDGRVVGWGIAFGVTAALLFSVAPAWRSASVDVQTLVMGRPRTSRQRPAFTGGSMVAGQVAIAMVLVFGALITTRALSSLLGASKGFAPENVVTLDVEPGTKEDEADRGAFHLRILETLRARADIVSAGATTYLPLTYVSRGGVALRTLDGAQVHSCFVLPGYFETIGMPAVRGRLFTRDDLRSADAAIISAGTARALFQDCEPLGQSLADDKGRRFTIVGVVGDALFDFEAPPSPVVYVLPGSAPTGFLFVAKTRGQSEQLAADVRREIGRIAPEAPVTVRWWSDTIARQTPVYNRQFQTLILGSFGTLALALCALGIFAVVSFLIASRTREIGIRIALGATTGAVVSSFMWRAFKPVALGIAIGLAGAYWLRRVAEANLYKVDAHDPATLVVAAVTVLASALLAAYIPARHAARVDPVVVLKAE